jgi:hypothetical protein
MSPLVRDVPRATQTSADIWEDELATVSPERWSSRSRNAAAEVPGAINDADQAPAHQDAGPWLGATRTGGTGGPPSPRPHWVQQITGPTKASALAPILADDLSRLQSILIHGNQAGMSSWELQFRRKRVESTR